MSELYWRPTITYEEAVLHLARTESSLRNAENMPETVGPSRLSDLRLLRECWRAHVDNMRKKVAV